MFTKNNYQSIDQEALRQYTANRLKQLKEQAFELTQDSTNISFWQQLHDHIALNTSDTEKSMLIKVESQLKHVSDFIQGWYDTAVDSPERLEFFIRSKAAELKSGDKDNDYYWAIQIRHDQLVGLIHVLEHLVKHLKRWIKLSPEQVLNDPVFQGMTRYTLEDQVYLEAQKVHKQREK